jgi:hypothetical protein
VHKLGCSYYGGMIGGLGHALNYCTIALTCFGCQAVCGHRLSPKPDLQCTALCCLYLQAVCAHWLSPIPTQEYPNFSAWMLYGEPTNPRTYITDRLCTALFLLCRPSAPTGCPRSPPKNTQTSPHGCSTANRRPPATQHMPGAPPLPLLAQTQDQAAASSTLRFGDGGLLPLRHLPPKSHSSRLSMPVS